MERLPQAVDSIADISAAERAARIFHSGVGGDAMVDRPSAHPIAGRDLRPHPCRAGRDGIYRGLL